MHRVAVYGTLKSGNCNNDLIETGKSLGEFKLNGFKMFDLGAFPVVVIGDQTDTPITVELFEVDDEDLKRMDILEGVDFGMYSREKMNDKQLGEFDIYIWNSSTEKLKRILEWKDKSPQ